MKQFDLFKLHSKKDRPDGWIWVYLDTSLLKNWINYMGMADIQRIYANILNRRLNKNGNYFNKIRKT